MARLFDDASSEYGENTSAAISTFPCTLAGWFNTDSTGQHSILGIGHNTTVGQYFRIKVTSQKVRAQTQGGSAAIDINQLGTFTLNTWHHAAATFSTSDVVVFIDGTARANGSGSTVPSPLDSTSIGVRNAGGVYSHHFSGPLADLAGWNAILSDEEILSLADGLSPTGIQPQNLISYWQLIGRNSPEPDYVGGFHGTLVNTPVVSDHPRLYMPFGHQLRLGKVPAAGGGGHANRLVNASPLATKVGGALVA